MNFDQVIISSRMIMEAASNAGADAASGAEAAPVGCMGGSPIPILLMYVAAGIAIYVMYRNQKKRREKEDAIRRDVEIGDEIVTIGGIIGRVVSVKEDEVIVIETGADRTKLKMKNWCISTNESAKERAAEAAAAAGSANKKPGLFGAKK